VSTGVQFRTPTFSEQALLERLVEADFPGREDLLRMIQDLQVKTIDDEGSLELQSRSSERASVVKRIPVEAEAGDEDGITIHVLLHVKDGQPAELEIFKDDGSSVKRMPSPGAFELIVLPPVPNEMAERKKI
jgi:hypothetical protein